MEVLTIILVVIAIIIMVCGSLMDMTQWGFFNRKVTISKEHLWFLAIFILLLAIIVEISGKRFRYPTAIIEEK